MSFIQEFKEFAMKGNVVDLAVGVIIGGAFGKIVSSFVGDVVMPALGVVIGGVNFSDLALTLGTGSRASHPISVPGNSGRLVSRMQIGTRASRTGWMQRGCSTLAPVVAISWASA